jgi:heterodisulfide reductase subunit B
MCQMNLDGWQAKASRMAGEDLSITVLSLPQLLGLALGIDSHDLGLDLNLAVMKGFREKIDA